MNGGTNPIKVRRGRTERVTVYLPYSVAGDEVTSEMRAGLHRGAKLIATWDVVVDEEDGRKIYLTLDDSDTSGIVETTGYMDLKRVTGGEPVQILENPLLVLISDPITA